MRPSHRARDRRGLEQERHADQGVLERILGLFDQVVVAGVVAVIGEEQERGVVPHAGGAQRLDQQAELMVDASAHPVVGGAQRVPPRLLPLAQPRTAGAL